MKKELNLNNRLIFTGIVTVLIWSHLAWDYFHGGVPTHHILHRADLPGISNWWGGIALPLLTWFLLLRIERRVREDKLDVPDNLGSIGYRFVGALLFGIILSFLFTIGSNIPGYMMIGLVFISFIIPIYKAEYLLGFVIGMTYTFGAILPIGFGTLLIIVSVIAYKFVRTFILYLVSIIKPKE